MTPLNQTGAAMTQTIAWIGLGKMGEPMARNLLQAGYSLAIWNRTFTRTRDLAAEGAVAHQDARVAAASADTVFTMVADDAALAALTLTPDGFLNAMRPGSTLVEMSTVSPVVSTKVAEACATVGVQYLRAPVSGSVVMAAAGKLTVIASGPLEAFDRVEPLLALLSQRQFHVGDADEARIVKLVVNHIVGATAAMIGEALAFGEKAGVRRTELLAVLGASAVASPLVGYKIDMLRRRDYAAAFSASQMTKDFGLILDAARDCAAPLPLAVLIQQGFRALIARGDGDADFFKYTELSRDLAGLAGQSGAEDWSEAQAHAGCEWNGR
jgi:3-hydroxyisobutyrate dehydrogenase-like beta-hydroxyacid dehydrogenase